MTTKWIWASLSISSMWMAVLFVGLFGPVVETESVAGDRTAVPVATFVAAFLAFVATIVVANLGFKGDQR
jgi:hypothetical protein